MDRDVTTAASATSILRKVPLWLWVIAAFLVVNVLTYDWYTSVWMDEVLFTHPAANEYFGRGFTSSAWPFQSKAAFWAGNVPLHSLLLCGWFKLFGFGIVQTRIFGYVIWSMAVGVLCLAARRFGWVTTRGGLALLAALAYLAEGVTFAFRAGRYDPLAVLVVCLCLLAFSIGQPRWRIFAILSASALLLPTCLTLGPFCVIAGALLFFVSRGKYWRELAAMGLGMAIGLGLLCWFYSYHGVWKDFLKAVFGSTQAFYNPGALRGASAKFSAVIGRKAAALPKVLMADKASLILALATAGMILFRQKDSPLPNRRLLAFGFLVFVLVPTGLLAAYAFQIDYWWMRYLPLCLAFVATLETTRLRGGIIIKCLLVGVVLLGISVQGLPGRLLLAANDLPERNYNKVENFVDKSIRPGDVVFADWQAFYPLEQLGVQAYYPWYLPAMNRQEADSITCLIINPAQLPDIEKKIGGKWQATGESYLNGSKFDIAWLDHLLPHYFAQQTNKKYNLAVYRRRPDRGAAAK